MSRRQKDIFACTTQERQYASTTYQRDFQLSGKYLNKPKLLILFIIYNYYLFVKKLFDIVRQINPDFHSKLEAIVGDLVLPSLGISQEDEKKLMENVNIVFHSAATVKFDEPIK